jgi:hypothetical protein
MNSFILIENIAKLKKKLNDNNLIIENLFKKMI